MKKLTSIILFGLMLVFPTAVFANSGPVFWPGAPSSDVVLIDNNSPIIVENEELVFDFSDSASSDFTINGKVTATYEMVNPTSEPQSVQMAFPFVGTLQSLSPGDIGITADDSAVAYDVYIGDVVESFGNPLPEDNEASYDFASIVNTITNKPYTAGNFAENEKGKLYIIDVKPTAEQPINFVVDFNFDGKQTKVFTNEFNGYERHDEKTKITAWCHQPETLEIYVLGEDVDLEVNAYTDGELTKQTDLFTYQISAQELELKTYLQNYIAKNTDGKNGDLISDTQFYNLYAKALDQQFQQNMGYCSGYDLLSQENYKRIFTIVYTVEFPPNSTKEVSVSYKTSGTMDKTKTAKPLYSFDYILNPAENWSGFNNFNLKIITPQEAPYIVKSSIELTKAENRVYTATLADLPEDDLSFTLYAHEEITLWDKIDKEIEVLRYSLAIFTPIVIGIALLIGVIMLIVALQRKKNKY